MDDDVRVVLASNRGPVSFVKTDDGYDIKRGAGGLAGALHPVARRLGDRAVWIAAATSETDRHALADGATKELQEQLGYAVHLLDIDPETYSLYYDVVSNRMLWFANHNLWDELEIEGFGPAQLAAWRNAYEPVNAKFAQLVAELSGPDDIVLFQDYHLTLAPGYLRAERPRQASLHFTHSSFTDPSGLERLPRPIPRRVIEGMLGADLLGFHVARWVEGFLQCCELIGADVDRDAGLVEHGARRTWVRPYPIPIDTAHLRRRAGGSAARSWAERFAAQKTGPLLVRADRTEPSKNIVRGFHAFGAVLDRRSDLRGSARFVACLYPSRQSMHEYRAYAEEVTAAAGAINDRHPGSVELFLQDDYDRTLGALLVYDALLVNPIMDGMNLVAKEGPALNENDGVLILSRGAGAAEELGEDAVMIEDPTSVAETADAIERALDMPAEERKAHCASLRERVESRGPDDWIEAQTADLIAIRNGDDPAPPSLTL